MTKPLKKVISLIREMMVANAAGTVYETGVGWVGVQTYMGSDGNLRVKKEILCAMSGITTGNTAGGKTYPNISLAN